MAIVWTLEQGVDFARRIEAELKPVGYHCSLGGSVLHSGGSKKDVDIFIYPHTTKKTRANEALLDVLGAAGVKKIEERPHEYDDKCVWMCEFGGRRVDVFFVK